MPFVGNRDFAMKVVGESFYDINLRELCAPAEDHMRQYAKTAVLTLENDNPYDGNAVRVDVDSVTVGHLSWSDAKPFRAAYGGGRAPRSCWFCDGARPFRGCTISILAS